MLQILKPHPSTPGAPVERIEVGAERTGARRLSLRYRVVGDMAGLLIPAPAGPARADGLWRHTCFEAFLRVPGGDAYWELNLSPSMQWAAYAFAGYRLGGHDIEAVGPLRPDVSSEAGSLSLEVSVDLSGVAGLPADGAWELGLSAVIEEAGGAISYWALAHPPGKPDFHHADCFALELVAPERS